jgi:GTP-binding protein HflX
VGAPRKRTAARHQVDEHLAELARLADTAGAEIIGTFTQQIDKPHSGTYLGSGKLDELRERVNELDATLVIFDDELSPTQGKNIEQIVGKRVMDRAELILDIFATRARSSEARMQVELAQLNYMLPRLTKMWTQLETDRRLIGHRIRVLRERLQDVSRHRATLRAHREGTFRVSLVGYTNAGKSSILRSLSHSEEVYVEDRLFATLDPLTRDVDLGEGYHCLLTDTVGFIRKLPHHLVASFRATLDEVREADLLLHVIDASHASWEEHRFVVDEVLTDIGAIDTPLVHVFNKMDLLAPDVDEAVRTRVGNLIPDSLFVSAEAEGALEPLRARLREGVRAVRPVIRVRVPASNGKLLSTLYRQGEVLDQEGDGEDLLVRVRVDAALRGRLERDGVILRV